MSSAQIRARNSRPPPRACRPVLCRLRTARDRRVVLAFGHARRGAGDLAGPRSDADCRTLLQAASILITYSYCSEKRHSNADPTARFRAVGHMRDRGARMRRRDRRSHRTTRPPGVPDDHFTARSEDRAPHRCVLAPTTPGCGGCPGDRPGFWASGSARSPGSPGAQPRARQIDRGDPDLPAMR